MIEHTVCLNVEGVGGGGGGGETRRDIEYSDSLMVGKGVKEGEEGVEEGRVTKTVTAGVLGCGDYSDRDTS